MRYVGVTRADVRRDCARHGDENTRDDDGVGSLYDTDDDDDGVGDGGTRTGAVSDGETTTTKVDFDDIMTGANAKHASMDAMGGQGMVLCGCDVIAALELTKCVNDGWDGAEEEDAS